MRTFLITTLLLTQVIGCPAQDTTDGAIKIPAIKVTNSPSKPAADYVMDLLEAIEIAKSQNKKVILYSGHSYHLKRSGAQDPKSYFENTLLKAAPELAARRSEFIVCELFEFSRMHDANGNFTPEYFNMITGWFGKLDDRYDIRFLTPTLNFLDSNGSKLAGPFDNYPDFGENIKTALALISKSNAALKSPAK